MMTIRESKAVLKVIEKAIEESNTVLKEGVECTHSQIGRLQGVLKAIHTYIKVDVEMDEREGETKGLHSIAQKETEGQVGSVEV